MITCEKGSEAEPEPLLALGSLFMSELSKAPGVRAQEQPLSASTSQGQASGRKPTGSGGDPRAPQSFLKKNREEI